MKSIPGIMKAERKNGEVSVRIFGKLMFLAQVNDYFMLNRDVVDLHFVVREYELPKSNQQLRYYFGVIVPTARQGIALLGTLLNEEQTDTLLRLKYHFTTVHFGDHIETAPASLAESSLEEMTAFIDKCFNFITMDLGIPILTPEEYFAQQVHIRKPKKKPNAASKSQKKD